MGRPALGAAVVGHDPSDRPRWRGRLVRAFVAAVLLGQVVLLGRGYADPHKLFAFQPFNESSTWRAEIVRVTENGRIPIELAWPGGYEWDELVGWRVLEQPSVLRHAYSGLDASVDFLDEALDWVADHTPEDRVTLYLEARVEGYRNARGPQVRVLRSELREEAA